MEFQSLFISYCISMIVTFTSILITLKDYGSEVEKNCIEIDREGTDLKTKERLIKLNTKLVKKDLNNSFVRSISISLFSVLLIFGVFFYILDSNYEKGIFILEEFEFINYICYGTGKIIFNCVAVIASLSLLTVVLYLQSEKVKSSSVIIFYIPALFIFGMIISGYIIKLFYQQDRIGGFYLNPVGYEIINEDFEINWGSAENAKRYFIYINDQLLTSTDETKCTIKSKIEYGKKNTITVIAESFGCFNRKSNSVSAIILPKSKEIILQTGKTGCVISPELAMQKKVWYFFSRQVDVTEEIKNLYFSNAEFQWLKDGVEISGANNLNYELSPDSYGSRISVKVTFDNEISTSNSIEQELGDFDGFTTFAFGTAGDFCYVRWNYVKNAEIYHIYLNDKYIASTIYQYTLIDSQTDNDDLSFYITAQGKGYNTSPKSDAFILKNIH